MITIAEVIEQCALEVDHILKPGGGTHGDAIRTLAAQYEGCIVADGESVTPHRIEGERLYRAKETK
jgi:hypothetical protein